MSKELKKKFYKRFPEYYPRRFKCTVDGGVDPMCVLDDGAGEYACDYSAKGLTKDTCGYWKLSEEITASYMSNDIWNWINKEILAKEN